MTAKRGAGALLLTPGAGSDRNHPSLVAIEAAVSPLPVARVDFPYRRAGRRAPDRADKLVACVVEEAEALVASVAIAPKRLVLGGRSMGGRICSMAVAAGLPAAGLVLISYPLHPPGKPDRLRDDHLDYVPAPMLFLQGTRDPFATPELLGRVAARLGPRAELRWVDGGDHSFRVPGPRIDAASIGAGLASPAAEFARRHATIGLD